MSGKGVGPPLPTKLDRRRRRRRCLQAELRRPKNEQIIALRILTATPAARTATALLTQKCSKFFLEIGCTGYGLGSKPMSDWQLHIMRASCISIIQNLSTPKPIPRRTGFHIIFGDLLHVLCPSLCCRYGCRCCCIHGGMFSLKIVLYCHVPQSRCIYYFVNLLQSIHRSLSFAE